MRSPGWTSAKEGAEIARNASASIYPAQFIVDFTLIMFESPQIAREQLGQDLRLPDGRGALLQVWKSPERRGRDFVERRGKMPHRVWHSATQTNQWSLYLAEC